MKLSDLKDAIGKLGRAQYLAERIADLRACARRLSQFGWSRTFVRDRTSIEVDIIDAGYEAVSGTDDGWRHNAFRIRLRPSALELLREPILAALSSEIEELEAELKALGVEIDDPTPPTEEAAQEAA